MSKNKLTRANIWFWFVTGVFVFVMLIICNIPVIIFTTLLGFLGEIGTGLLLLLGGILFAVSLVILGFAARWGTKQVKR